MSTLPADPNRPAALAAWHDLVAAGPQDHAAHLDALLAPDVVFRSPAIHTPQEGKALTTMYLGAAMVVLGPTLRYLAEWYDGSSAVLEFEADLGEGAQARTVHGVDMVRWNEQDQIVSFTVMARPHQGLEALMGAMVEQLRA